MLLGKLCRLSMEGQKDLRFHQKGLQLCSEDERKSYGVGTTRGLHPKYCFHI
ncbi:hypothetical protein PO909_034049 [Leuciscus waleckii]